MKLLFALMACVTIANAQISTSSENNTSPALTMLPFGIWLACENNVALPYNACNSFVPGNEQYEVSVRDQHDGETAYEFEVTGLLKSGAPFSIHGIFPYAPNTSGYTYHIVSPGGIATEWQLTMWTLRRSAVTVLTRNHSPR